MGYRAQLIYDKHLILFEDATAMGVACAYEAAAPQMFSGDLMPDFRES